MSFSLSKLTNAVSGALDAIAGVVNVSTRMMDFQEDHRFCRGHGLFLISLGVGLGTVDPMMATSRCYQASGLVDRRVGLRKVTEALRAIGAPTTSYQSAWWDWEAARAEGYDIGSVAASFVAASARLNEGDRYKLAEYLGGEEFAKRIVPPLLQVIAQPAQPTFVVPLQPQVVQLIKENPSGVIHPQADGSVMLALWLESAWWWLHIGVTGLVHIWTGIDWRPFNG